jgi:N-acylglucosamine 2-epimerase
MFDKIIYWVREDPTDLRLGLSPLPGVTPVNSMAVPMMLLCVLDQMETMESPMSENYADVADWSLKQVLNHKQVGFIQTNCFCQNSFNCIKLYINV